ncbi:MAG: lipopolysaccharide biosynthesis protein, partial [Deltaproteobacteria bacterium]
VLDRVVSTFDLETVYETTDSETPRADAIRLLQDNVEFVIDQEYGFIAVEVYDQDPERAAAMANFFVEELNRVNSELLSQNAANYRRFMEQSLRETEAALDSALAALQRFQERHGVIDLPTQTQAFLQNIAALRTDVLQAEIQAEVLRRQYGPDNPRVRAMQDAAAAAQTRYEAAFQGSERMLPVPQTAVPELARQYAKLQQEVLIQGEILKFVRPLYEQARFDEQREKMAVQVLDPAVPPERKARPKRSIIVIMATLSAGMLAVLFVLLTDWWRRNYRTLLERLTTMASSQP